uniref:Transposase n=1 Tax=Yersinia ruckeri TaxID=29486 RepID=A0A0A8VD07_YERRU|nr:hypothetical protein CSF007_0295 [Yersinia ruckeri]
MTQPQRCKAIFFSLNGLSRLKMIAVQATISNRHIFHFVENLIKIEND